MNEIKYKRLYEIWSNMKRRCYNPKEICYKNYGGRGIIVCNDWKNNFMLFYNWALFNGYDDHLTIERNWAATGLQNTAAT